jgi:PBP1b-binding outer membrane lipoprotein LpoB
MIMRRFVVFAACCASVFLAGCSGHTKAYLKKDQDIPTLVVPSDVPVIKQQPYFPVPNLPPENTGTPTPNLKPPTLQKK